MNYAIKFYRNTEAIYLVERGVVVSIPRDTPPELVESTLLAKISSDPVMLGRYRALQLIRSNDNMIPTIPYFQAVGMAVRLCIRNKTPDVQACAYVIAIIQSVPELYPNFVYMVELGTGYTQAEQENYMNDKLVREALWTWFNIFSIGGSVQAIIPALMQE